MSKSINVRKRNINENLHDLIIDQKFVTTANKKEIYSIIDDYMETNNYFKIEIIKK